MSAVSAAFSSSKRSMRSTRDFNCPAAKPDFAILRSNPVQVPQSRGKSFFWQCAQPRLAVSLLALGKRRLRVRACLLLIASLPFAGRHAIDDLARLILFQGDALLSGGFAIPIAQAVPAEAGEVHHVDVLDFSTAAQMRDQAAECGGFKFSSGLFIHDGSS